LTAEKPACGPSARAASWPAAGAFLDKALGGRPANAGRTARDEGDLILKAHDDLLGPAVER
jgi:hypothetical protein